MNTDCAQAREALEDQFDLGRRVGEGLEQHLAACSICAAHAAELTQVLLVLHTLPVQAPSESLLQKLKQIPERNSSTLAAGAPISPLGKVAAGTYFTVASAAVGIAVGFIGVGERLPSSWLSLNMVFQQLAILPVYFSSTIQSLRPGAVVPALRALEFPMPNLETLLASLSQWLPHTALFIGLPLAILCSLIANGAALRQLHTKP